MKIKQSVILDNFRIKKLITVNHKNGSICCHNNICENTILTITEKGKIEYNKINDRNNKELEILRSQWNIFKDFKKIREISKNDYFWLLKIIYESEDMI